MSSALSHIVSIPAETPLLPETGAELRVFAVSSSGDGPGVRLDIGGIEVYLDQRGAQALAAALAPPDMPGPTNGCCTDPTCRTAEQWRAFDREAVMRAFPHRERPCSGECGTVLPAGYRDWFCEDCLKAAAESF